MTMDVIQSIPNLDWLSVWVKAYAFIHAGDNQRAINTIWWAEQRRRPSTDRCFASSFIPHCGFFSQLSRKEVVAAG